MTVRLRCSVLVHAWRSGVPDHEAVGSCGQLQGHYTWLDFPQNPTMLRPGERHLQGLSPSLWGAGSWKYVWRKRRGATKRGKGLGMKTSQKASSKASRLSYRIRRWLSWHSCYQQRSYASVTSEHGNNHRNMQDCYSHSLHGFCTHLSLRCSRGAGEARHKAHQADHQHHQGVQRLQDDLEAAALSVRTLAL
jgi:hypothetical protein